MKPEKDVTVFFPLNGKQEDDKNLYSLLYTGLLMLRENIKNPLEENISWNFPRLTMNKNIGLNWDKVPQDTPKQWEKVCLFDLIDHITPITIKVWKEDGQTKYEPIQPAGGLYFGKFLNITEEKKSYTAYLLKGEHAATIELERLLYEKSLFLMWFFSFNSENSKQKTLIQTWQHETRNPLEHSILQGNVLRMTPAELDDYVKQTSPDIRKHFSNGTLALNSEELDTIEETIFKRYHDLRKVIGYTDETGQTRLDPLLTLDLTANNTPVTINLNVLPLFIDIEDRTAFFPIDIDLEFKDPDINPDLWEETEEKAFWNDLLKPIRKHIPKPPRQGKTITPTPGLPDVVKLDRTTEQDLLPALLHKGIFTGYKSLLTREEIEEKEKKRLNKDELTKEESRAALTRTGQYKDGMYVMRDYGDHAIGFTTRLFLDALTEKMNNLKEQQNQTNIFPEGEEALENELKTIRLYRTAYQLAKIILSYAYSQHTAENIVITKENLIKELGYTTSDKQKYQEIKNALYSLKWVDYIFKGFSIEDNKKNKGKSEMTGNFVYNIQDKHKEYILDINKKFIGCALSVAGEKRGKETFQRGYYDFVPAILSHVNRHNYSDYADFYAQFLHKETGNNKLNTKQYKVISKNIKAHISGARIKGSRENQIYADFLKTLEEVQIIHKTEPDIETLKNIRPARTAFPMNLRVWVIKDPQKFSQYLKELDAKK